MTFLKEGKENNEPRNKNKRTKSLLNLNNVSVDLKDGKITDTIALGIAHKRAIYFIFL